MIQILVLLSLCVSYHLKAYQKPKDLGKWDFPEGKLESLPLSLFKQGGDASIYTPFLERKRSEYITAAAFHGTSFVYSRCATFKLQM